MTGVFLSAFFKAISAFFGWKQVETEKISEHEIIEDKQDLEKACRHAEIALACADKYKLEFSKLDRASFIRNTKKFRKLK